MPGAHTLRPVVLFESLSEFIVRPQKNSPIVTDVLRVSQVY